LKLLDRNQEPEQKQEKAKATEAPNSEFMATPPRIAVIGTRNLPANYGGVETACEKLYTRLAAKGHNVTVYCRSEEFAIKNEMFQGVRVIQFPAPNVPGLSTFLHCMLASFMATLSKAEILHFHAQGPALFSLIPKLLSPGKKIVFTCHGKDWERPRWGRLAKAIIRLGEWCSAHLPHYRITVSNDLEAYYQSTYQVQAKRLYNGVELPVTLPLAHLADRFDLLPGEYLLFVGRLVPEKTIETLIQAFSQLNTSLKLVIVGDSPETPDYVNQLKTLAYGNPQIVFTATLRGDDLKALYSNAKAFVSASTLEGHPITVLEALSYGLPVLLSDIPPHQEIMALFPETALPCFPIRDVVRCKAAMKQLLTLSPQQCDTLKRQALQVVQTHFDWDQVAQSTQHIYQQILSPTSPGKPVLMQTNPAYSLARVTR
jgi:glycosyltransferase involved in cell wall biosynthesis